MDNTRRYYEAYDDRYRQVHAKNLRWFDSAPSKIVEETIREYHIEKSKKILEIGCGEGRDAAYLLKCGYDVLATDISQEAVSYCKREYPAWEKQFQPLDCVNGNLSGKFDFIYAVAVVHMLVEDEDRTAFYSFVCDHLTPNGVALICTMGDGEGERKSDISTAFALQRRTHEPTGTEVEIAGTSYRAVSFDTFDKELRKNGLVILKQGMTDILPDYWKMMYAIVKRKW